MATIKKFEDLQIWRDAVSIAVKVYQLSSRGALERDYASKDQIRRSAVSMSNNIAEGFEYNNNKVFVKYLKYSKGSAGELRSNLLVLKEAKVIEIEDYENLRGELIKLSKSLEGFIKYLKTAQWTKNQ
jgi:four helix bundle protein